MSALQWVRLGLLLVTCTVTVLGGYLADTEYASDASLLRAMVERMGSGLADPAADYLPMQTGLDGASQSLKASLNSQGLPSDQLGLREAYDLSTSDGLAEALELGARRDLRDGVDFGAPRDLGEEINVPRDIREEMEFSLEREKQASSSPYGVELSMHPSLRDQEYLQHSHLLGNRIAQFQSGGSYGMMRIKPSGAGSPSATSERKTDGVLPAYCNPPNPCPLGYTASDGCLEEFQNTAAFSRNYQGMQECMCDTEHMFDCPDTSRDGVLTAMARSLQNQGLLDIDIDTLLADVQNQPYMRGEKLPVAAKKGSELP